MCSQKTKKRCIEKEFKSFFFKPRAIPMGELNTIQIAHDELEAIRLVDIEKLDQEKASSQMNISRGTIQRMLEVTRAKIAKSLIEGYAIKISGGHYQLCDCKERHK